MRGDGSGRASVVLLGLPGFVVVAAAEVAGEVELLVETAPTVAGCRRCGVVAEPHGRRPVTVRDLPVGGRPVTLVWLKRLWRCPEPGCPVRTWSETSEQIRPRAVLTERARRWAMRRVGEHAETVASVRRQLGVGWHTVMRAVREYGEPLVDDPNRLNGWRRSASTSMSGATPAGPGVPASPPASSTSAAAVLRGYSTSCPAAAARCIPTGSPNAEAEWRQRVRVATLDPFRWVSGCLRGSGQPGRAEHDIRKAERRADMLEEDAADAIDLALYVLDQAEYAIVAAVIARADADELARQG